MFEADLEDLLEKNPQYFSEDEKFFLVGKQVTTNFNASIYSTGVYKSGNNIVMELKRNKIPREIIAQILKCGLSICRKF